MKRPVHVVSMAMDANPIPLDSEPLKPFRPPYPHTECYAMGVFYCSGTDYVEAGSTPATWTLSNNKPESACLACIFKA